VSLADDLLMQARRLAGTGRGRSRQADLRRAVSAAYYALFHFLVEQACREFVGAAGERRSLRHVMSCAFQHSAMKDAAQRFKSGQLSDTWQVAFPGPIPPALRTIAGAFVAAQEDRHEADYDLTAEFIRTDAVAAADRADQAMRLWVTVSATQHARLFLISLLAWRQLQGK
jgi:hypothetical protein